LFLYLAASAEAVSMVLVAERTEQARQGDTRVSPAKDGEPNPRHGGPAATPLSVRTLDMGLQRSLDSVGTQNRCWPKDLT